MLFKRKVYNKLLEWKEMSAGESAVLLEGARRIGKSTIVEEFAKNEYDDYMILDFARENKDVKNNFNENMLSEEAIFYKLNDVIYEQTKDKSSVILDQTDGSSEMSGGGYIEERTKNFKNMDYDGKKKEIFEYLEKIKSGKTVKKSEKNLKLELKDEYVESAEEKKDSSSKGIYIVIGVVLIVGVVGVGMFLKKRKTR